MTTKQIVDVETELAAIRALFEEQTKRLDDLRARLARGTHNDLSRSAEAAKAVIASAPALDRPVTLSIGERLELALRDRPRTLVELSQILSLTPGATIVAVRKLGDKVYNLGTEHSPRWFWRVGDAGPTSELIHAVSKLLSDRPFGMRELLEATGARIGRVSGAIVSLQRQKRDVRNLGTPTVARWFLVEPLKSVDKQGVTS